MWENTDGCDEKYICTTVLYLLLMLDHVYNIIIGPDFGSPCHGRSIVDGLKTTGKLVLSMLI